MVQQDFKNLQVERNSFSKYLVATLIPSANKIEM